MNEEYLTEAQKVKIEVFCKDTELVDGIKKVLLQHIYSQGVLEKGVKHNPFKNRAFALIADNNVDNAQLGSNIKAWFEGVNALEAGFYELTKIKSKKEKGEPTPYNEAI